jgi:hypothetical protein
MSLLRTKALSRRLNQTSRRKLGSLQIIGRLDQITVGFRYLVTPFVGMVMSSNARPNWEEVSSAVPYRHRRFLNDLQVTHPLNPLQGRALF